MVLNKQTIKQLKIIFNEYQLNSILSEADNDYVCVHSDEELDPDNGRTEWALFLRKYSYWSYHGFGVISSRYTVRSVYTRSLKLSEQ